MLKTCEKVLKKYFRYLFRYLPVKLSGDVGSSGVHSRTKNSYKMLSNALKIPQITSHVGLGASISSAVGNSSVYTGLQDFWKGRKTLKSCLDKF